jgi:hypothetical protein
MGGMSGEQAEFALYKLQIVKLLSVVTTYIVVILVIFCLTIILSSSFNHVY